MSGIRLPLPLPPPTCPAQPAAPTSPGKPGAEGQVLPFHLPEKPKKEGSSPKREETDDKWTLEKGKDHKGVSGAGIGPLSQVRVAELWAPGPQDPWH